MTAFVAPVFQRWRERPPSAAMVNGAGISIGVWDGPPGDEPVAGEPLEEWLVSILLRPMHLQAWVDGRPCHSGRAPSGAVDILSPGAVPRAMIASSYRYVRLSIPPTVLSAFIDEHGLPHQPALEPAGFQRDDRVASLAEHASSLLSSGCPIDRLTADTLGTVLLAALLKRYGAGRPQSEVSMARGGLAPPGLRRALEYLEAHLSANIGLAEIAATCNLSPNHFCTAFRQSMGEPPHRYLMRRRVERACKMLADPRLPVTEVAFACGFASSAHFATAFRKQLGTTPSAYRRERLT